MALEPFCVICFCDLPQPGLCPDCKKVQDELEVKDYLKELKAEGQVIVDDFDLANRIYESSASMIGKRGAFGLKVYKVRLIAAVPAVDAGRSGYKVITL
ncbi:hypothetical protein J7E73_32600 [Paenibacillus albidus]|uniref:hypothetical protein n=1 Tax=Paenibacillus albidus TaxID=2041023 RepID=UPI001BE9E8EE|nr:hypothetical protein [Paenibacillus albidus]MBT2293753.1 hypothetical protein [Paenibacillus albidus]